MLSNLLLSLSSMFSKPQPAIRLLEKSVVSTLNSNFLRSSVHSKQTGGDCSKLVTIYDNDGMVLVPSLKLPNLTLLDARTFWGGSHSFQVSQKLNKGNFVTEVGLFCEFIHRLFQWIHTFETEHFA